MIGIPILIGTTSSAIGLNFFSLIAGIKMHKPIIKKKKAKHDKILLLAKSKSNSTEALISKDWINSVISHDKFISIMFKKKKTK